MKKYEAMFIVKPDLGEEASKTLFNHINEVVTKHEGVVSASSVWSEKRKLYFKLKKQTEGVYYLLNFDINTAAIPKIASAYNLNEDILRVMITSVEPA